LNWRLLLASNWKTIILLIQFSLLAITLATGHVLAEPIDNPGGP
jgi:hypothetical protein